MISFRAPHRDVTVIFSTSALFILSYHYLFMTLLFGMKIRWNKVFAFPPCMPNCSNQIRIKIMIWDEVGYTWAYSGSSANYELTVCSSGRGRLRSVQPIVDIRTETFNNHMYRNRMTSHGYHRTPCGRTCKTEKDNLNDEQRSVSNYNTIQDNFNAKINKVDSVA